MSRTLTTRQAELVGRKQRAAVTLMTLTTYSDRGAGTVDTVYRFADRSYVYDGNRYEPFVESIGSLSVAMSHIPTPSADITEQRRELTVSLLNAPWEHGGSYLAEQLQTHNLQFATVAIAQLDLDRVKSPPDDHFDGSSIASAEAVVWYRGELSRWGPFTRGSIALEFQSERPTIPYTILSDPATNDPRDLGKRLNHVYGQVRRAPCHGVTVGHVTSLSLFALPAGYTGNVSVTDATGFPSSGTFTVRVGAEDMTAAYLNPGFVTISARGVNGTPNTEHLVGTAVLEVLSSAKWGIAGHACKAVSDIFVRNVYNGAISTVDNTHYSVNLADTVDGAAATTFSMSSFQLRSMLNQLQRSANVSQQPVVSHATSATLTDQSPFSGSSNLRDGNIVSGVVMTSPAIQNLEFASPGGTVVSQSINVYVDASTSPIDVKTRPTAVATPTTIGTIPASIAGWFTFVTANNHHHVQLATAGGTDRIVTEVRRDISYTEPSPSLSTNTAIVGTEFGAGLEFWADVDGYAVPGGDTNFSVAAGSLIEHPADVIRHRIAILSGKGHAAVDATTFAATVTNLGSGTRFACTLNSLGDTDEEIDARLAFECRSNLVPVERSTGTVWQLLNALSTNAFPAAPSGTDIDDYASGIEEESRDQDQIATRFRALYLHDPTIGETEDAYGGLLRADPVQSDIATPNAAALITAETRFGRRDMPPFGLRCIDDSASAEDFLSYIATEMSRASVRVYRVPGVPWWLGYAIEVGDVRMLTVPWLSAQIKGRVIGYAKDWSTELVDLTIVEVT